MNNVAGDPRESYARRLEERRQTAARLHRRHIWIGNLRLAVAVAAVAVGWQALGTLAISPWWLALPIAAFLALMKVHERVLGDKARAGRAVLCYERGLARIEDRWTGTGEAGERFRNPAHPYSEDLDLFGRGSLFELLSTARTARGEEILASWLLEGAPPEEIAARQAAVNELRDRMDLREDLFVLGEDVRQGVHAESLLRWAEQPPLLISASRRAAAAGLSLAALAAAAGWWAWGVASPLAAVLAVNGAFGLWLRTKVLRVAVSVERAAHDLELLSEVLARIEKERFTAPRLAGLRLALEDREGHAPSRLIARLHRLVELLDSRDNVAVRVIGPPLLYTTQLAFAVEAWRLRNGRHVREWVDAVGEIEALAALAGYAREHPADPFPEIVPGPALFDGADLGHPLLPAARMKPNSLRLGGDLHLIVVSGSNMSGKSTLLRTVGVNAVLAMAGAPVRARGLRMSTLAVGASIRVTDSLQGGTSRFYAEIQRLRQLAGLAGEGRPLLFLLDELLHGTNSHDRRIGAEGVVKAFLDRGAIGLVTTHDLALAGIAAGLGARAANMHFEDHLEDGRIQFDYKLRAGVVEKSNALELMRSVGLEV